MSADRHALIGCKARSNSDNSSNLTPTKSSSHPHFECKCVFRIVYRLKFLVAYLRFVALNRVIILQFQTMHRLNPFQSNFSATHIFPSSYLFWAGKRFVDYL
jgi:hypothetical protein